MSVPVNSANNFSVNRSYFIECCEEDYDKVAPIAKRIYDLGINVEMSCGLDYVQRIEKIRSYDVVIFFVSKKLFRLKKFEMHNDYECCLDHNKPAHCICLDNIDTMIRLAMPAEAYAFWSKIKEIQGINLKLSADDYNKAFQIIDAVENPSKREIRTSKLRYLPSVLITAAALMYIFAVSKHGISFKGETKPLEEFTTVKSISIGSHVTFGSYEQDGNTSNGSEAIEWIVLDKSSDKVLLISDKLLDYVQYNDKSGAVTWSECSLRSWMNNEFFNQAFNSQEKQKIALSNNSNPQNSQYKTDGGMSTNDRVFALSESETAKYFSSNEDMAAYTTEFANMQGHSSSSGADYWWLRSPGKSGEYAADVSNIGGIVTEGNSVALDTVAVRPAMWVHIS